MKARTEDYYSVYRKYETHTKFSVGQPEETKSLARPWRKWNNKSLTFDVSGVLV